MSGLIGKKIGMTRVPLEDGTLVPVTLIGVEPNVVTQIKTQAKDGYDAVSLAFGKKIEKPTEGKAGGNIAKYFRVVKEFRVSDASQYKKDQELTVAAFDGVAEVSIQSSAKGHGFAGVVKRHHFKGGPRTHGAKMQRAPGSIGTRKPRRTKRGKRLPGHMGTQTVTVKHVSIIKIDTTNNIIALKGPVPGGINSVIKMWIPVTPTNAKA